MRHCDAQAIWWQNCAGASGVRFPLATARTDQSSMESSEAAGRGAAVGACRWASRASGRALMDGEGGGDPGMENELPGGSQPAAESADPEGGMVPLRKALGSRRRSRACWCGARPPHRRGPTGYTPLADYKYLEVMIILRWKCGSRLGLKTR